MRNFLFWIGMLALVNFGATLVTHERTGCAEKMLIYGLPAWGPSVWLTREGEETPAGCGPEAARLLLLYYDLVLGTTWVRGDPESAIRELHQLMGTITVEWQGVKQGLTWPWAFRQGLRAYLEAHGSPPVQIRSITGGLGEVFFQAVRLLQEGTPGVLLFDWQGAGGIFPTHYAVVVGYDLRSDELVLNPGWGYEFQLLSFRDDRILPVSLMWLESPVLPRPHEASSVPTLPLTLYRHSAPGETTRWPAPTRAWSSGGILLLVWD